MPWTTLTPSTFSASTDHFCLGIDGQADDGEVSGHPDYYPDKIRDLLTDRSHCNAFVKNDFQIKDPLSPPEMGSSPQEIWHSDFPNF